MRRIAVLLATTLLTGGCASLKRTPPWSAATRDKAASPSAAVAQADELATSKPQEARELYRRVLKQDPPDAVAAEAMYGLARLRLDPTSPLKDYRLAAITLARLRARYPNSPRAAEVRAWQAALGEIDRCESERGRLRTDLDRLKEADIELEGEP